MQQMTGLDHMFLALDSATTNAVMGGLVKYEKPEDGQPVPDEAFMIERLSERLPLVPPMSKKMVQVPLALDHNYLAHIDRVDIGAHVRTVHAAQPGTDVELAAEVSRIMSSPFATDHVMWDLTIIDGLEDGRIAHLLRIHHAVVDGATMPQIWDLFSDDPATEVPEDPTVPNLPEPLLGSLEMTARAVQGTVVRPFRQVKLTADVVTWAARRWPEDGWTPIPALVGRFLPGPGGRAVRALVNRRQRGKDRPEVQAYMPSFFSPETPFNGRSSARRHFVLSQMDLARVKDVKNASGTTLNNVIVTLCAAALRRYLKDLGIERDEPLVVCIPVSLRTDEVKDPWSNHVHMMFAKLPVHIADPVERLEYTTEELTKAKASFDGLPTHLIRDSSRFIPRDFFQWAVEAWIRFPSKWSRAPWNVVVSNVKGPRKASTMNGLRMAGLWPASFLSIGGGINITLQSYVDKICFGFIGAPELTGDLWPLTEYMQDALKELEEAVDSVPTKPAPVPTDGPVDDESVSQPVQVGLETDSAAVEVDEQKAASSGASDADQAGPAVDKTDTTGDKAHTAGDKTGGQAGPTDNNPVPEPAIAHPTTPMPTKSAAAKPAPKPATRTAESMAAVADKKAATTKKVDPKASSPIKPGAATLADDPENTTHRDSGSKPDESGPNGSK